MKTNQMIAGATLFIFSTHCAPAFAQEIATWNGGTSGREYDWNCAANWKEGKTPNEHNLVLIPANLAYYPVIKAPTKPVAALVMEAGSALTLRKEAALEVSGTTGDTNKTSIQGYIENHGTLILNLAEGISVELLHHVYGSGDIQTLRTMETGSPGASNPKKQQREGFVSMGESAH